MSSYGVAVTINLFNGEKFTRQYSSFITEEKDITIKTDPGTTEVHIKVIPSS